MTEEQTFEHYIEKGWDQATLPFSHEKAQEMYYLAYKLYRDQQYEKAHPFFQFLTVYSPLEAKYWKGSAASLHMQKKYKEAIPQYICAEILNKGKPDPYVYVHAADCYFALEQPEDALKALEGARHNAEEQNNEQVMHHVSLMTQQWKK